MSANDRPEIKSVPCDLCSYSKFNILFSKKSNRDEVFSIVECKKCKLVQVNPQPNLAAVVPYYTKNYFDKRSDRGYDNYFSESIKNQINKVYDMNLRDLNVYAFETDLLCKKNNESKKMRALDVGCAAGYFVEFMKGRGWSSLGIEVSREAASHGIEKLGLDILVDDFLVCDDLESSSFDFLSFWASIEHMHSPRLVLKRCRDLLVPGGRLILSTCRWGLLSRMRGVSWRYMNVPEHLYFFSVKNMIKLADEIGFRVERKITYGSGLTTKKGAGIFYNAFKKIADPFVKWTGQGDMMAFHFVRKQG